MTDFGRCDNCVLIVAGPFAGDSPLCPKCGQPLALPPPVPPLETNPDWAGPVHWQED
jgi:hypothetical protein